MMQPKNMSIGTKKKLAKLLTYTGESEQRIEFCRQNLCKAQSFEPYAAFQRLDRAGKGYITPRDFGNFMRYVISGTCTFTQRLIQQGKKPPRRRKWSTEIQKLPQSALTLS